MLMRARIKRGFTLLELIVVLVILGIIALIAIPTFQSLIDSSSKRSSTATAVNIVEGANLAAANDGDSTTNAYVFTAIADLTDKTGGTCNGAASVTTSGCKLDTEGDTKVLPSETIDDTNTGQDVKVMVITKAGTNSGGYTCIEINTDTDKAYITGNDTYDDNDAAPTVALCDNF